MVRDQALNIIKEKTLIASVKINSYDYIFKNKK